MKLATPFDLNVDYIKNTNEFNILYKSETATLDKLISFFENYLDIRINIEFEDEIKIEYLKILQKIHNDFAVRIISSSQAKKITELKENNIKFFFDNDFLPCYSFALLDMMISLGVSDIYISDILCYNMEKVKELCEQNNIQIRLVLNLIPQLSPNKNTDIKAPIFNPRDREELDKYIDVAEFECGSPYDWHKEFVYYKAWFIKEDWYGDLREINLDLQIPCIVETIIPGFLNRKFNCGRKCSLDRGSCRRCEDFMELTNDLFSRGVGIDKTGQK